MERIWFSGHFQNPVLNIFFQALQYIMRVSSSTSSKVLLKGQIHHKDQVLAFLLFLHLFISRQVLGPGHNSHHNAVSFIITRRAGRFRPAATWVS